MVRQREVQRAMNRAIKAQQKADKLLTAVYLLDENAGAEVRGVLTEGW